MIELGSDKKGPSVNYLHQTQTKFVIQVGGALGLWLGLGVLQVLQQLITIAQPILKKFQIRE